MNDDLLRNIVNEIREEYQIPPYFSDESLKNYVTEGEFEISKLSNDVDFEKDKTARSFIKVYAFYCYNKKVEDFFENHLTRIRGWQYEKAINSNL